MSAQNGVVITNSSVLANKLGTTPRAISDMIKKYKLEFTDEKVFRMRETGNPSEDGYPSPKEVELGGRNSVSVYILNQQQIGMVLATSKNSAKSVNIKKIKELNER